MKHPAPYFLALLSKPCGGEQFQLREGDSRFICCHKDYRLRHWDSVESSDGHTQLYCLGRPCIETGEWSRYRGENSYVTEGILARYLGGGGENLDSFARSLDGAFTILINDHLRKRVVLITDRLGMYPVYGYQINSAATFELSTHPDLLSSSVGEEEIDPVSVAEFLKNGFVSLPFSYYKNIATLEHRSVYSWSLETGDFQHSRYHDFVTDQETSVARCEEMLVEGFREAVQKRTQSTYGNIGVFLSGGSDSRIIACNAESLTTAISVYRNWNRELRIAGEVADALGLPHKGIERGADHYLDSLEASVYGSGGVSDITSDHYLTLSGNEAFAETDLLLSGCYFDYMFKGLTLDKRKLRFAGRTLTLNQIAPFRPGFYIGSSPIGKKYAGEVVSREDSIYHGYSSMTDLESRRFLPLFREYDSVMRLSLQRYFQWDLVSADKNLVDCFCRIPGEYKVTPRLFERAAATLTQKVSGIPHADTGCPIGASAAIRAKAKTKRFVERLAEQFGGIGDPVYGQGSWVNNHSYAKRSSRFAECWDNVASDEREIVNDVMGEDVWRSGFHEVIARDTGKYQVYRVLTWAQWHRMLREGGLFRWDSVSKEKTA